LKKAGLGVLLVEQQVEAAIDVADHVVVLDIGRVILDSPARELVDLDVLKEAYFGSARIENDSSGGDEEPR
jgi:branched-chain amino acid transport system ATP-binding protein